jgi:hypothetical protein
MIFCLFNTLLLSHVATLEECQVEVTVRTSHMGGHGINRSLEHSQWQRTLPEIADFG